MKGLLHSSGKAFVVKGDVHTQFGFVPAKEIGVPGTQVKSNKDHEFTVIDMSFMDRYTRMKRGAQIMSRKDIGFVIAETGIGKDSVVVDAGAGSGAFACLVARWAKKVHTFDVREDHVNIVKKNIETLELKNVTVKLGDIYKKILVKNADVLNLDVPEPWLALETAEKCLKPGGYVVSYSPTIVQSGDFVNEVRSNKRFSYMKTVEMIQREWEVDGRKVRPQTKGLGHTGFLSIARRR